MDFPIGMCTASTPPTENEFQIFPAGRFNTQDGRPKDASAWVMTSAIAERLITAFDAKKNPMVVDYEHQTILAKDNGKPAPAAGWVHGLEWREGKGLFAIGVKWTDAARASIQSDEYRYISPVFHYNKQNGEVSSLFNVSLTNTPALDGMEAAVAHSLCVMAPLHKEADGLFANIQAARSDLSELEAAKERLTGEIAALKTRSDQEEIDKALSGYFADGKLAPAEREAARILAQHDFAALRQLLDLRTSLFMPQSERVGLSGKGQASTSSLTAADLRACELTGRKPEEFAALKAQFFNEPEQPQEL